VLLIDEAQLFRNRDAMEEFRGLLNLLHDGRKLVSLVLFGLHELADILKLDPPLAQRVEIRVELTPMDWLESQAYVSHRLRLAGATQAVFSPDALEALFRCSGGVPRLLNTVADNALFEAFLSESKPVDSSIVAAAASARAGAPRRSDRPEPAEPARDRLDRLRPRRTRRWLGHCAHAADVRAWIGSRRGVFEDASRVRGRQFVADDPRRRSSRWSSSSKRCWSFEPDEVEIGFEIEIAPRPVQPDPRPRTPTGASARRSAKTSRARRSRTTATTTASTCAAWRSKSKTSRTTRP
jgi:hypothetical protein